MVSSADLSQLRIDRGPRSGPPLRARRLLLASAVAVLAVIAIIAAVIAREPVLEVRVASAALRGGAAGAGGLTANGYVVARTKASISSKVAGRLAFLGVEEGDRVTAGTVIARLEAAEYEAMASQARAEVANAEAARHEAEAAVAQAERALARARTLAGNGLIAPQAHEDAETAVVVTRARLEAARARVAATRHAQAAAEATLENTRVRAPFTGTVLRKDAEVGEVVAPSVAGGGLTRGAVVTIADLSTLEVEVDVNEAYIAGIGPEQPALIVLDAYPAEAFPGRVRQVVPTADRQKATVLVRVAIDSDDPRILPEMGARVVFQDVAEAGSASAAPVRVFAPAEAVRTEDDEMVVYVVREDRAIRVAVDAAPVSGGEREVRSGLRGGEVLVLDPPAELEDGARVRVAEPGNR
ncbi:MAG TPA: efflux RND transporter periplasmic adaptor subunit [Longimicrobiales bacterium]|nr:efflux RND transporter periplasmic adaptor subunit [Longimicrobiales bacterium]